VFEAKQVVVHVLIFFSIRLFDFMLIMTSLYVPTLTHLFILCFCAFCVLCVSQAMAQTEEGGDKKKEADDKDKKDKQ